MNIQLSDTTSVLGEEIFYTSQRGIFDLPCVRDQVYKGKITQHFASVSWQSYLAADVQLKQIFNKLARKWKRDTMNLSIVEQMILHPAYQEIIGLGKKAIPLILRELEKTPDFWFWALRSLTGVEPVKENMRGDVIAMTEAWLNWGRRHEYI